MASLLASLKSDHMPEAPVRLTVVPGAAASASSPFSSSAARTMPVGSSAAPPMTMAVRPSALRVPASALGGTTVETASSPSRMRWTSATVARNAGSAAVSVSEATTTWSALLAVPPKAPCDRLAHLDRLGAGVLPARSRQGGLDPRREGAEADDEQRSRRRDDAPVGGRPAAEAPDGADLREFRGRVGREGGHDDTPATAAESSEAWRSMLPQTASQIAITVSSAIE